MQIPPVKRIAVDFDGTLVEEKWPQLGEWLPGAQEALRRLASEYDEVVIFSCRVATFDIDEVTPRENWDQLFAINKMLAKASIPKNVKIWTRPFKPPARYYIDDRGVEFKGDWEEVLTRVA
jgi:hypothetical protein